jgi:hypothetical protein
MRILAVADTEEKALWDHWNEDTSERLSDVGLILSAGDLSAEYLEFLVTMLNVPLVYVRGNHDGAYENTPPEGCIDADGLVVEVKCPGKGGSKGYKLGEEGLRTVRILGFGGSMRYKYGARDMYSEREMTRRVVKASLTLTSDRLRGKTDLDILLTHSPCSGYGDMEDLPHQGFKCFNSLLEKTTPKFHVYGHVHKEYSGAAFDGGDERPVEGAGGIKGFHRMIEHPSGTTLINASGYQLIEI